jgi:hypothetical protein
MERITKIWIALLLFSLFAFILGRVEIVSRFFIFVLLFSTFLKGYFVIEHFMGLSEVTLRYRLIPTVWLSVVIISVAITYY